jgi:hypothetical protein
MARGINGYTDTLKLWGVCEDKDLNNVSLKQFGMSIFSLLHRCAYNLPFS